MNPTRTPKISRTSRIREALATVVALAVFAVGGSLAGPGNKSAPKKTATQKVQPKKSDRLIVTQAAPAGPSAAAPEKSGVDSLGTTAPLDRPALSPINQSTADVKSGQLTAKPAKKLGSDLTVSVVDSVRERADADRMGMMVLEVAPWVALGRNYKLDAYSALSREMNGFQETRVTDARLGLLRNPIALSKTFKFRPKLTLALPVDSVNREVNSYLGGISLGNRFLFERGAFSGYYQVGATKNFYEYTTTGLGESNPSYGFSNTLKTVLSAGKFYFDLTGSMMNIFTFENTASTNFGLSQEIGFSAGTFSVGVGHTNEDSLFKSNGTDSNLSLFNANSSKFYISAGISI